MSSDDDFLIKNRQSRSFFMGDCWSFIMNPRSFDGINVYCRKSNCGQRVCVKTNGKLSAYCHIHYNAIQQKQARKLQKKAGKKDNSIQKKPQEIQMNVKDKSKKPLHDAQMMALDEEKEFAKEVEEIEKAFANNQISKPAVKQQANQPIINNYFNANSKNSGISGISGISKISGNSNTFVVIDLMPPYIKNVSESDHFCVIAGTKKDINDIFEILVIEHPQAQKIVEYQDVPYASRLFLEFTELLNAMIDNNDNEGHQNEGKDSFQCTTIKTPVNINYNDIQTFVSQIANQLF